LGGTINLDDISHIEFLEKTKGHIPERISCRFNPGGHFEISNQIMDNPGDAKYGLTRPQMFEAFRILKEKGVKEFGIHAFLASNTKTNDYYPALAGVLFTLAVELKKQLGVHIGFINLSGGVGIPYEPTQQAVDILEVGDKVHKIYDEILVPAGMGDVSIYSEMGRFMLGPYGCLVTKVLHKKHIHKEYWESTLAPATLCAPQCTVLTTILPYWERKMRQIPISTTSPAACVRITIKFAVDRMLPEIDIGDYIVIHDTGAHGFSMGYNYNGKLRSAEVLLKEDGSAKLIRRPETPNDYFATLNF
jgi:diaminopimelate decarboxylase